MIGIINKSFKEYCGKFGLNQLLALSPRMYIPSLPDKTDISGNHLDITYSNNPPGYDDYYNYVIADGGQINDVTYTKAIFQLIADNIISGSSWTDPNAGVKLSGNKIIKYYNIFNTAKNSYQNTSAWQPVLTANYARFNNKYAAKIDGAFTKIDSLTIPSQFLCIIIIDVTNYWFHKFNPSISETSGEGHYIYSYSSDDTCVYERVNSNKNKFIHGVSWSTGDKYIVGIACDNRINNGSNKKYIDVYLNGSHISQTNYSSLAIDVKDITNDLLELAESNSYGGLSLGYRASIIYVNDYTQYSIINNFLNTYYAIY